MQHLVQHLIVNRGYLGLVAVTAPSTGREPRTDNTAGHMACDLRLRVVARGGVEPPTFRFPFGVSQSRAHTALGAGHRPGWPPVQQHHQPPRGRASHGVCGPLGCCGYTTGTHDDENRRISSRDGERRFRRSQALSDESTQVKPTPGSPSQGGSAGSNPVGATPAKPLLSRGFVVSEGCRALAQGRARRWRSPHTEEDPVPRGGRRPVPVWSEPPHLHNLIGGAVAQQRDGSPIGCTHATGLAW